jgi:hypothetical protein
VANFAPVSYPVDVSASPAQGGSVAPGSGDYCGPTTFEATANQDYEFVNWTIDGVTGEMANPLTLNITAETTLVANFELIHIPVTVVTSLLPATEDSKAGRTIPIKFSLRLDAWADPSQPFVYDESLTIKIFATSDPGNILQTSTFGNGARNYRIAGGGKLYITNFQTSKVPMQYTVEIYKGMSLIGSFTFKTVK